MNAIKKHKLVVGLLFLPLLFSGCDSWKTDLEALIDQESKDYCLFAEGSYWIYQDSATLDIDSVVIDIPIEYISYEKDGEYGATFT
ncbi:hypothetical protein LJC53_06465 [Bacteroidales bacterium OttesenSCG-928-C03]|nr:hypothetical protein [Bacteroidales bacterium OttesenSCG-928-C03]